MSEGSLYDAGWRQGTLAGGRFTGQWVDANSDGSDQPCQEEFLRGVVCTQDCDLNSAPADSNEHRIEVRPIHSADPPGNWGIRSRVLRLNDRDHVIADGPRAFVTPAFLTTNAAQEGLIDPGRATALKTWLGLRYDRPALPEHLVTAAREVARRCSTKGGRVTAEHVHDVLMQFNDDKSPPWIALYAIVTDDADQAEVRRWLADAASRVDTSLGVIAKIEVATRNQTSLELVETSYAADLSQLTWNGADPNGAT